MLQSSFKLHTLMLQKKKKKLHTLHRTNQFFGEMLLFIRCTIAKY